MKRRAAIRYLLIVTGGCTLLPSCLSESKKVSISLKNLDINSDQEKLLAEIVDTIIPQTDTPGAKELGVHLFVLKMLDDCYGEEQQNNFVKGLKYLEDNTERSHGRSFVNCTLAQRERILKSIENKEEQYTTEVSEFYKLMKQKTIQGYLNSKYVMTNLIVYELIPGRYDGYFPVKKN